MPPFVAAIGLVTGAAIAWRLVKREWDRVNRELEAAEAKPVPVRTLRRDPRTGEWREG